MSDEKDEKEQKEDGTPEGATPLGEEAGLHLGSGDDADDVPIDFGSFIVSLGTSVMVNLGHTPNPETGQTEKNLDAAKQTIDILDMLREKTEGNLDPEEQNLLDRLLQDLRMAYVNASDQ